VRGQPHGAGDPGTVLVLAADSGPLLDLVDGDGSARAIVWPGMGARHRSLHRIRLAPGAATRELRHPSDAVYAVVDGSGEVHELGGAARALPVGTGAMVHVDRGTAYQVSAGAAGMELVGGPAPADPGLYEASA
jgi:mannose-6-phosphate isomerase-like protein (cupin superfamily)